jgi:hypothetical protein
MQQENADLFQGSVGEGARCLSQCHWVYVTDFVVVGWLQVWACWWWRLPASALNLQA